LKITGTQTIAAPRASVWEKLNDPSVLAACIEGCTRLDRISDHQLEGTVTIKIGPVKASFNGMVTLTDIDAPNGYTLTGEGKGGAAGFVKGSAAVQLANTAEDYTILTYEAEANVGGKLAQLGARLIEATARDQADKFFTKFNAQCTAEVTPPQIVSEIVEESFPQDRFGLPAWVWGFSIAALTLGTLYFLAINYD
jgi:uncharacterized protein